eukprot:TRINITY_DN8563_c0_g1_i1.p1 TRINITY_DN8563_c0_g1~~TRINITY_DN8563_c0_g1_i1.p1  ORF type:complete len:273 (-),score=30.31 TRINITY_DN8563_c0_g1_i1:114-932(-)
MAAGITVHYDTLGLQTADLVNNQWPTRPYEPKPKEYSRTNNDYGVHVHCHAGQSYVAPNFPAGTSKRMGAFYEKTGVAQHRTEPGFRDTKGLCTLTEVPLENYGTMRRSTRLPGTATMMLSAPGANGYSSANSNNFIRTELQKYADPQPHSRAESIRSRASNASSRRSAQRSEGHGYGGREVDTVSVRSGGSRRSQYSQASSAPTWAKRSDALRASQPSWNFEQLPMYERTNATYGRLHKSADMSAKLQPAGKSDSGFLQPAELIAALTRPE